MDTSTGQIFESEKEVNIAVNKGLVKQALTDTKNETLRAVYEAIDYLKFSDNLVEKDRDARIYTKALDDLKDHIKKQLV